MNIPVILKKCKQRLYFRNKRGYGVHSPFAFDLIMNVINSKSEYYAFSDLRLKYNLSSERRKHLELLFKLILFFNPQRISIYDYRLDEVLSYVHAASSSILEDRINPDFIFIGRFASHILYPDKDHFEGVIFISDIYKNPNLYLWNKLKLQADVVFCSSKYGILVYNPKLQPGHYNL